MSMWLSNQSLNLSVGVIASARAIQLVARSLLRPATLRRAQSGVVRLITVVAGH